MSMPIYVEEAKAGEKQCPLSFAVQEIRGPDGGGIRQGGPWVCIGAACMAWRYGSTHINNPSGEDMLRSDDTHGFCGLAGVPGQRKE